MHSGVYQARKYKVMRILFILSGNRSETEKGEGELIKIAKHQGDSLIRMGYNVDYFFIRGKGLRGYLGNIPEIRKKIKAGNYDIVHAHYSLSAIAASLAGKHKMVVSLMGSDTYSHPLMLMVIRAFCRFRWDVVIVKTEIMRARIRCRKAIVLPNGVEVERFHPAAKADARRLLELPGRKIVMFAADPSRPEKNFKLAQEAFTLLDRKDAVLLPVFNKPGSQMPLYMNAADVLLLTSLWEGSVNVVKEAMACNLPVVSTDVGDVKSNTKGLEGYYITSFDAPEIAKKLAAALDLETEIRGADRIRELGLDSESVNMRLTEIYRQVKSKPINHNGPAGAVIIEGHVQGLSNLRSLGEAGIPVIVVDKGNCIARYSKYCKKFFYCPDYESDEFAVFLSDLADREGLQGWLLLPSNDHAVHTIARNREHLGSLYRIITPALDVVNKIYDKKNLIQIAESLDLPVPKTQYFRSVNDRLSSGLELPVITKGRFGLSFYKVMRAKAMVAFTEQELHSQLKFIASGYDLGKTFTQELIPSTGSTHTVSFTAFCIDGEIKSHWTGQKLREHPLTFGTATLAESITCRECHDLSVRLLRKLNYSGICEIEYLKDIRDGRYKLIEINARTWLWVGLAKRCGINYALMAYRHVNGQQISFPGSYDTGIKWINYLTDTLFSIRAMLSGKLKPGKYFSDMKGKRINAVFSWHDPLPSLALIMLSFYIARKRG